jgi:hypothetical protein
MRSRLPALCPSLGVAGTWTGGAAGFRAVGRTLHWQLFVGMVVVWAEVLFLFRRCALRRAADFARVLLGG